MSVTYRFEVVDTISAEIQGLMDRAASAEVMSAMGASVAREIRGHLRGLPANRMFPGQTTNFWKRASTVTNFQLEGDGVAVNVNQVGVRQRFHGGTIKPTKGKYLTIPARAEAYGKSAREFNNLRFVRFASGAAALVETDATKVKIGRRRKDGSHGVKNMGSTGGGIMYWLKTSVSQKADPNVLPSDELLAGAALRGARAYLQRKG